MDIWECLFKRERIEAETVIAYIKQDFFCFGLIIENNTSFFKELYLFGYIKCFLHYSPNVVANLLIFLDIEKFSMFLSMKTLRDNRERHLPNANYGV